MSETNPEELNTTSPEQSAERHESAAERKAELDKNSPEKGVEVSPRDAEQTAERALAEARESSLSVEAGGAEKKTREPAAAPRKGPISKKQRNANYKKTVKQVQAELTPASRAFSKFIHAPVVEKASEVVGSTVARPNAILAGAVCAFILTLAVYVIAKLNGYALSGFETIAAFIVGWIIGLIYDYLRAVVTGKNS